MNLTGNEVISWMLCGTFEASDCYLGIHCLLLFYSRARNSWLLFRHEISPAGMQAMFNHVLL